MWVICYLVISLIACLITLLNIQVSRRVYTKLTSKGKGTTSQIGTIATSVQEYLLMPSVAAVHHSNNQWDCTGVTNWHLLTSLMCKLKYHLQFAQCRLCSEGSAGILGVNDGPW